MRDRRPLSHLPMLLVMALACRKDATPQVASQGSDSTVRPKPVRAAAPDTTGEWGEWAIQGHPQFGGRAAVRGSHLVVGLDTMGDGPTHPWVPTDSVLTHLTENETFSTDCSLGVSSSADTLVGLVLRTDTASVQAPRLAWVLDLAANKVRSISPDSIRCVLEGRID